MGWVSVDLLRKMPIWAWAPVIFGLLKIAYRLGLHFGWRERRRVREERAVAGGQVTLGARLTLLGLLMAFTY